MGRIPRRARLHQEMPRHQGHNLMAAARGAAVEEGAVVIDKMTTEGTAAAAAVVVAVGQGVSPGLITHESYTTPITCRSLIPNRREEVVARPSPADRHRGTRSKLSVPLGGLMGTVGDLANVVPKLAEFLYSRSISTGDGWLPTSTDLASELNDPFGIVLFAFTHIADDLAVAGRYQLI